jgi:hypothetical protein
MAQGAAAAPAAAAAASSSHAPGAVGSAGIGGASAVVAGPAAASEAASSSKLHASEDDRVSVLARTGALVHGGRVLLPLLEWQMHWCKSVTLDGKMLEDRMDKVKYVQSCQRTQQHADRAAAAGTAVAGGAATATAAAKDDASTSSTKPKSAGADSSSTQEAAHRKYPCFYCATEPPTAAAAVAAEGPSDAAAAAGLYGALPVPWSDPFMMRRLLWDLLGKLKPTAQAWFMDHGMCPHNPLRHDWCLVALSLARHIWAPAGTWGAYSLDQMNLMLPARARNPRGAGDSYRLQRAMFARELNLGFAQQGADGQVAALLSMQALLALDPHSARVQPKPELLYFTPAGFHVSVMKTLMEGLLVWPAPDSDAPRSRSIGVQDESSSTQQDTAGSQGRTKQQQQQQEEKEHPGQHPGDQQHDRQQQQEEVHCQQMQQNAAFWSQAALPAWYMWWHIGLLAYHQQQQQQQQDFKAVGNAVQPESAGHQAGRGSTACTASCSVVRLQDLYSSTDAR